eukprot:355044-Chlamydomonas_euryale.AAC.2
MRHPASACACCLARGTRLRSWRPAPRERPRSSLGPLVQVMNPAPCECNRLLILVAKRGRMWLASTRQKSPFNRPRGAQGRRNARRRHVCDSERPSGSHGPLVQIVKPGATHAPKQLARPARPWHKPGAGERTSSLLDPLGRVISPAPANEQAARLPA